jgi:hypothetical protein
VDVEQHLETFGEKIYDALSFKMERKFEEMVAKKRNEIGQK